MRELDLLWERLQLSVEFRSALRRSGLEGISVILVIDIINPWRRIIKKVHTLNQQSDLISHKMRRFPPHTISCLYKYQKERHVSLSNDEDLVNGRGSLCRERVWHNACSPHACLMPNALHTWCMWGAHMCAHVLAQLTPHVCCGLQHNCRIFHHFLRTTA